MSRKMWSTPTTMDTLPPKSEEALLREAGLRPCRRKPSNLRDQVTQQDKWNQIKGLSPEGKKTWPTPVASDRKGGVSDDAWNAYTDDKKKERLSSLKNAVLFPTPGTTGLSNGSGNCERANELFEQGVISEEERRSFRAGNGGQLNPDWTSWLMGWPIGWTSLEPMRKEDFEEWEERAIEGTLWTVDPADLSPDDPAYIPRVTDEKTHRKERLMALGNGQVPSCVCLAESVLEAV